MTTSAETAVITGGASGIGFAIAKKLLSLGRRLCIWDADQAGLAAAQGELGGCAGECVDITDADAVAIAAARTEAALGRIDILVHSAGIAGPSGPVSTFAPADWRRVVDIDLNGTFYVNQAVIRGMIQRNYGRIVNIASIAGKEGNPNAAAYSAAKAGVIAFTKSLGKETAQYDIAVNCITPAAARTRIFDQISQQHIDYMLARIPRGRFVRVEEIADMVAFLVSRENSFTTGGVFDLSGGRATY